MEFFKQEYWSGLHFASKGDFPDPVIEPGSSALQADFLLSEPSEKPNVLYNQETDIDTDEINQPYLNN